MHMVGKKHKSKNICYQSVNEIHKQHQFLITYKVYYITRMAIDSNGKLMHY